MSSSSEGVNGEEVVAEPRPSLKGDPTKEDSSEIQVVRKGVAVEDSLLPSPPPPESSSREQPQTAKTSFAPLSPPSPGNPHGFPQGDSSTSVENRPPDEKQPSIAMVVPVKPSGDTADDSNGHRPKTPSPRPPSSIGNASAPVASQGDEDSSEMGAEGSKFGSGKFRKASSTDIHQPTEDDKTHIVAKRSASSSAGFFSRNGARGSFSGGDTSNGRGETVAEETERSLRQEKIEFGDFSSGQPKEFPERKSSASPSGRPLSSADSRSSAGDKEIEKSVSPDPIGTEKRPPSRMAPKSKTPSPELLNYGRSTPDSLKRTSPDIKQGIAKSAIGGAPIVETASLRVSPESMEEKSAKETKVADLAGREMTPPPSGAARTKSPLPSKSKSPSPEPRTTNQADKAMAAPSVTKETPSQGFEASPAEAKLAKGKLSPELPKANGTPSPEPIKAKPDVSNLSGPGSPVPSEQPKLSSSDLKVSTVGSDLNRGPSPSGGRDESDQKNKGKVHSPDITKGSSPDRLTTIDKPDSPKDAQRQKVPDALGAGESIRTATPEIIKSKITDSVPKSPSPETAKSKSPSPEPLKTKAGTPEPLKSKPISPEPIPKPKPLSPEPIKSKSVTPEPLKSKPVSPEPVKSKPPTPEQLKSKPLSPEPVKTKPVSPEPLKAKPLTPEPSKSKPVTPEPLKDKPSTPEQLKTKPNSPEPLKTKPPTPEPLRSKPTSPEPVKTKPATPEPLKSKPVSPETLEDQSSIPETLKSKPTTPEPLKSKPTTPEPLKSKPQTPEPLNTKPLSPDPIKTKPFSPEPIKTKPLSPEPIKTKPLSPEPITTKPLSPEPIKSKSVTPEPIKSKPVSPEPLKSKPPTPEQLKSKPLSPEPVKTKPVSPEPLKTKPPTPEPIKSKPATPEPPRSKPPTPDPSKLKLSSIDGISETDMLRSSSRLSNVSDSDSKVPLSPVSLKSKSPSPDLVKPHSTESPRVTTPRQKSPELPSSKQPPSPDLIKEKSITINGTPDSRLDKTPEPTKSSTGLDERESKAEPEKLRQGPAESARKADTPEPKQNQPSDAPKRPTSSLSVSKSPSPEMGHRESTITSPSSVPEPSKYQGSKSPDLIRAQTASPSSKESPKSEILEESVTKSMEKKSPSPTKQTDGKAIEERKSPTGKDVLDEEKTSIDSPSEDNIQKESPKLAISPSPEKEPSPKEKKPGSPCLSPATTDARSPSPKAAAKSPELSASPGSTPKSPVLSSDRLAADAKSPISPTLDEKSPTPMTSQSPIAEKKPPSPESSEPTALPSEHPPSITPDALVPAEHSEPTSPVEKAEPQPTGRKSSSASPTEDKQTPGSRQGISPEETLLSPSEDSGRTSASPERIERKSASPLPSSRPSEASRSLATPPFSPKDVTAGDQEAAPPTPVDAKATAASSPTSEVGDEASSGVSRTGSASLRASSAEAATPDDEAKVDLEGAVEEEKKGKKPRSEGEPKATAKKKADASKPGTPSRTPRSVAPSPRTPRRTTPRSRRKEGDHDKIPGDSKGKSDETKSSTNGEVGSPTKKSPTKIPSAAKKSPATPNAASPARPPLKSPAKSKTPPALAAAPTPESEKKKVPMNKVQVGTAASPNLKAVRSKIGSLDNASYKPGGGKVKIENRKLDFSKTAPKIAAKNDAYVPGGGDKKIQQVKLAWSAKPKVGSLDNATYKPGGGEKKIETVKLDFKDKAKPKVGSKDNIKHAPGGGVVKKTSSTKDDTTSDIESQKLEFKDKAQSKIGSMDNVKHKPGGGERKIFDDKNYLKQVGGGSSVASSEGVASGAQSPQPPMSPQRLSEENSVEES